MNSDTPAAPRGRPPTITRERIANAGIAIGLPELTFVGVAARLGVSHMGLYKHVSGLEELRRLIAEEIFLRWQFPPPAQARRENLQTYMTGFAESIWRLVAAHPGIAPYLLRGDMITPAMTEKIVAHQEAMMLSCGLTFAQSRWLLLTIAFHCVAVADTVLPRTARDAPTDPDENPIDPEHRDGIRALIIGAMSILDQIESFPYPVEATAGYQKG